MRMPRVVDDQRLVFQQDTTLSQLSRLCPVAYTGALHARDIRERQNQLRHDCQIGRIPLVCCYLILTAKYSLQTFPGPGINLDLYAQPPDDLHITDEHVRLPANHSFIFIHRSVSNCLFPPILRIPTNLPYIILGAHLKYTHSQWCMCPMAWSN